MTNIEPGTPIVKSDGDTANETGNSAAVLSDTEFADRLEVIAKDIETFERTRRKMILRIAKLVSEAHDLFLYRRDEGGFTGWMKARFNCSSSSAYRLLDVYKRFGDGESFPNWETLSDSALYLLAPPSVPQEAIDQVAERVEAGEKPSCAVVAGIIAQAKDETAIAAEDDEDDPSIAQRRREHDALFGEPAGIDQHGRGDADQHTDCGAAPKSIKPKTSAADRAARKQRERFERTLFQVHCACDNTEDMAIPELTAQEHGEAAEKLAECMGALQVLAEKLGGVGEPKGETLIDHWRRSPGELTALLDAVTPQGMCEAMSPEFRKQLGARLPKGESDKPFKKTLNLTVNHAHGRDHRFRH